MPYLYLSFTVDDSIVDDFTQRGDHNSGPMCNPKLTGMVMWISLRLSQTSRECWSGVVSTLQKT